MEANWTVPVIEPTLQQVTADPMIHLVMQRDGLEAKDERQAHRCVELPRSRPRQRAPLSVSDRGQAPGGNKDSHPLCRLSRLCEGILPFAGSITALIALLVVMVVQN